MELPLGTMLQIDFFEPFLFKGDDVSDRKVYQHSHGNCRLAKNTGPEQGEAIIPKIRKIYSLLNKTISWFTSSKNNSNYKTIKCNETKPLRIKDMHNGTATIKWRENDNPSVWKTEMELPLGTMIEIMGFEPVLLNETSNRTIYSLSHGDCWVTKNTGPEQGAGTISKIRNQLSSLVNKTTSWFTSLKNNSNYQMEEDPEVEEPEVETSIEPEVEEPEEPVDCYASETEEDYYNCYMDKMEEDPEVEEPEVETSIEPEVEEPEEPADCYASETEEDYYNCYMDKN